MIFKRTNTASTGRLPEPLDHRTDDRLEFWRSVADAFGVGVSAVDDALIGLEPLAVLELLLPGRSAEERNEVMWALGEFERRSNAAGSSTTCACAIHPAA